MSDLKNALIKECLDEENRCLYSSTALYIWLRCLRWMKVLLIGLPLVLGSLASSRLLLGDINNTEHAIPSTEPVSEIGASKTVASPIVHTKNSSHPFLAICAFLAAVIPSVYAALKYEERLAECVRLAGEFKILEGDFRYAANVLSHKEVEEFEKNVQSLRKRINEARRPSYTAPEWCFKLAQKKIAAGHYTPDEKPESVA